MNQHTQDRAVASGFIAPAFLEVFGALPQRQPRAFVITFTPADPALKPVTYDGMFRDTFEAIHDAEERFVGADDVPAEGKLDVLTRDEWEAAQRSKVAV